MNEGKTAWPDGHAVFYYMEFRKFTRWKSG